MGGLAGDELLITFARRLILALRAGDVLARTGGNEFGVLVSLRRGVEDALKAAERIQQVMAAPFKLSELEIRVECAIGVALMHAGPGPRRAVPQRPVRGQAGQSGRQARRSTSPSRRPRRGAASRSRPSFAGRSTRTS